MAALLVRAGRRCRFDAGAIIQQQGDTGDGFWLVETGKVTICRFAPSGTVTIFGVVGPNDLFGELAHFGGVVRQVDVVADTDVSMVHVDTRAINALLDGEPAFARWLLKSLAHQLRAALDRIEMNQLLSAEARIAGALVEMVRREGPELQTTQEELANYVGVSRVTVGQILRRFAQSNAISLGYRRILVLRLADLSERFRSCR